LQQSLKVQIKKTSFIRITGEGNMPVLPVHRHKLIKYSNILTMLFPSIRMGMEIRFHE